MSNYCDHCGAQFTEEDDRITQIQDAEGLDDRTCFVGYDENDTE